uniref:Uncharacterized protein n=1 Tax=Bionectria ochroleuca TaxID=29856 RepID=A0A0B7K4Z9_BIOOC
MGSETLLVITPFTPAQAWIDDLRKRVPGINVHVHPTEMYAKEFPTMCRLGKRHGALHSAGANQILGLPLFEKTDIVFSTSNGVHPPEISEWVFASFLGFQHHFHEHHGNQKKRNWVDPDSDEDVEDAVVEFWDTAQSADKLAFGMDVHAYTLHERPTPESRRDDGFTEPGLVDPAGEFPPSGSTPRSSSTTSSAPTSTSLSSHYQSRLPPPT